MWKLKTIRKISALTLLVVLGLITLYGLREYISHLLAAIVLFVLFSPLYNYLRDKLKIPKILAAFVVILATMIVIVAPLLTIFIVTLSQVRELLEDGTFVANLQSLVQEIAPTVNVQEALQSQITNLAGSASDLIFSLTASFNYWFIGIMLMYFSLYFLLVTDREKLFEITLQYIPFNRENSIEILREFRSVTSAILVSNLLMAIIQGAIFGLAFHLAGVKAAIIWAFVAFVLSFLPIVGPIMVALPAIIAFLITGNYYGAFIMLGLSITLTLNDSFLRPIIQEKMGDIHPMVSVVGFIMGVVLFGMIGIVVGPILLSYFLITLKMFGEEYIQPSKEENSELS